jgi:hypothetical protein
VNEVIQSKEALQMAGDLLMSVSQSERERAIFRSRRMYQSDLDSNLKTAEDRGEARGEARGLEKGIAQVARSMKNGNIPTVDIVKFTGLTASEIERL